MNDKGTITFLSLIPVMFVPYGISIYVIENLHWFCVTSALFILFSAEHIYNFIGRTDIKMINKYSDSNIRRPFALGLPFTISFVTWGIALSLIHI